MIMDKKKKVLFIHHGTGIGGASICLKELVLSLKDEIEPTILCIKDSSAVIFFQKSGINTILLNSFFYRNIYSFWAHIEGITYNSTFLSSFLKIILSYIINGHYFARKVLREHDSEIIYLNTTFLTDWAFAAKKEGKKVIIHVREPLGKGAFGLRRSLFRKIIRKNVDYIIAISHDNAKRVNLLYKTTVVYDPMRSSINRNTIIASSDFKYFLYLGGVQKIKGFYVLISSLPYLNNNIKIFVAGTIDNYKYRKGLIGNLKKIVEKYWIKKMRNSTKIIEIGLINNVYEYLDRSHFLLFPSTIPHFAGPVMEAYSVGKPVLVSDVEGMDEIVNEKTGFFFKRGNSEDLAKKINFAANISSSTLSGFQNSCINKYNSIYSKNNTVIDVMRKII